MSAFKLHIKQEAWALPSRGLPGLRSETGHWDSKRKDGFPRLKIETWDTQFVW
jgi:hypothetical protein